MNFDGLINYKWDELFTQILDGIKRVFEFLKNYMPKAEYGFEAEDAEWNKDAE